ncbi:TetR/AcrR family transcriptional regulator [Paenarthrobacter sp. Z7-10]|uniref:TetR/AcrR family transcriptional regulator n=1 Tax=Paenarthrobacter sp. Z7-10 TaxID=2787635 RepID=UPI0022A92F0A|nr:TetR/AcrR family transcriptional regulator [Paenarthrobacter sp. Z7-10]MCZ2404653.1 TetR/AcrR family transcriptional regulator [Paenarthrobacter sp. Z7-10]
MQELETRERVINTAVGLFYTKGIQAVGMDLLRESAGVSLRTLYRLFPSKDAIVLAVLRRSQVIWNESLDARVVLADTPRDKLLAIYDYLADWFTDDSFRGCCFINSFAEVGPASPEVAAIAREHKASFQAYVAHIAAEAGFPAELAAQLAILAEGALTTAAISGSGEAAGQARRAAEVLIGACLPPQPMASA